MSVALVAALFVALPANASQVSVDSLMSMGALSFQELVTRAKGAPDSSAKKPAFVALGKSGIQVNHLITGQAVSFGTLVQAASPEGAGVLPVTIPGTEVASTKKGTTAKVPLTVTVTIGAEPEAEPVATVLTPAEQAKLAVQAATKKATASNDALSLTISDIGGALKFKPQTLIFPHVTSSARVTLSGGAFDGLAIFVRDQGVVSFDQKAMTLSAHKKGVTEVYAVIGGKMYIVPVTVEDTADGSLPWDLKVPDALVSLDGVFQTGSETSALFPGLEQAGRSPARGLTSGSDTDGPLLGDSVAETERTVREVVDQSSRYVADSVELNYKPVTIQVIDDRSAPRAGRVYPVGNAIVRLVGTEFAARTDATGHLTIRDVPADSRFLLRIEDDGSIVRSGLAELVTTRTQSDRVARIRVIRNFSFDAYANIAGVSQHAAYASYCATAVDPENGYAAIPNISVGIDAGAEGPFYFNRYGFLDRALHATGPDGRFCFYNIVPGPLALSIFEDGAYVATFPASTFPGRHVDEEIVVGSGRTLTARLATMGTAHEQLGSDTRAANSYRTIDMIDLIPLGTETPMMQLAPGRVQSPDPLLSHNGRLRAFAQASEFEPTIYTFGASNRDAVVPLVPRGFIEDMSVYAQVAYNPELGVVLTEYGHPEDAETITLRLIDQDGRDVGDGWYFSDRPVTKAIFFNVPSGTYALLAETSDGFWLGADTVMVYNETVSYVRLGTPVRYRP